MRTVALCILSICQLAAQSLTVDRLELHGVTAKPLNYQGRAALRVVDADSPGGDDAHGLAIVKGTSFEDGTVEAWLTGDTAPDAPANLRGFVGIAFRVGEGGARYECMYLRPKNGRSDDQMQRNHSVQYISVPGFPWEKLRAETPGKYESDVDLVPGEWTRVKISVEGSNARIYVNGAPQPVLIVRDLKQPRAKGAVALWVGPGTIANFADLKVTP